MSLHELGQQAGFKYSLTLPASRQILPVNTWIVTLDGFMQSHLHGVHLTFKLGCPRKVDLWLTLLLRPCWAVMMAYYHLITLLVVNIQGPRHGTCSALRIIPPIPLIAMVSQESVRILLVGISSFSSYLFILY